MAGDVMCISATGTNSSMYLQATKCAVINSKDSTTQVTLGNQMGAQTLGVTGAAGGQSIYVYECYFSDGTSYGASGRGSHDIYGDPQFVSTRNISTFSQDILGNVGTDQQLYNGFHDAMILMNGWDESTPPARVTPNPAANWEQVWQYITEGYTPKNRALWCAGNDGESMGAVKFCGRGKALQGATLSGM
jgi:hypothetical protein